jgi:DDE superfamily endonuclease
MIHKCELANKFFEENDIELLEWPSQSPDINVIEHLWAYIKKEYAKSPAKNKKEIFEKIKKIWSEVPVDFITKLISSIYNRLEAVIRQKGGPTNY